MSNTIPKRGKRRYIRGDYSQSANSLFHFVKELQYLKDILQKKAVIPRYCKEDIEYLNINVGGEPYREIQILQKCFCDIPLHKLTEQFALEGTGIEFEKLSENERIKLSQAQTHTDFYGEYGIAFSKVWGEEHNLQPVHYINEKSEYCHEFSRTLTESLQAEDLSDVYANDLLRRLAFSKPLRGIMGRKYFGDNSQQRSIYFYKNFHDENEWRYVPSEEALHNTKKDIIIANPQLLETDQSITYRALDLNMGISREDNNALWLKFDYDDIRYIIVRDSKGRQDIIETIMNIDENNFGKANEKNITMEKYVLISKIIVLNEMKKDW